MEKWSHRDYDKYLVYILILITVLVIPFIVFGQTLRLLDTSKQIAPYGVRYEVQTGVRSYYNIDKSYYTNDIEIHTMQALLSSKEEPIYGKDF